MLTFLKAQTASLVASAADFMITVLLVELAGMQQLPASIEGTISGGIINFIINRSWTFSGSQKNTQVQAMRYIMVWSGSLVLNAFGFYLVNHYTGLHYTLSKILISILVGILYNYFLQKRFVFK
ncbi:MAG: GtrA family protein [Bacteroidota bacterium]